MADYLRFSFQAAGDSAVMQKAIKRAAQDPFEPVNALVQGAPGVVLITRVSEELHQAVADAVAAVLGARQIHLDVK